MQFQLPSLLAWHQTLLLYWQMALFTRLLLPASLWVKLPLTFVTAVAARNRQLVLAVLFVPLPFPGATSKLVYRLPAKVKTVHRQVVP